VPPHGHADGQSGHRGTQNLPAGIAVLFLHAA
jgi:hypothetical protein